MDGHENKLVTRATGNTGFASGFLFYSRPNGSSADLVAQAFDPSSGRVEEEPRVVVQGIEYQQGPDQAAFAVSDRLLIYQLSPTGTATTHSVVWLDRSGKKLSVVAPGQDSFDLRLSPDGQRLAYSKGGPNSDIWIQELKRDVPMRVTFDTSVDKGAPTWSPDGNEIAGQTRPSIRNLLDLPNSRLVRSSTVPQIPIVPVGRNWETEPKRLPFGAVGRNQILSTW